MAAAQRQAIQCAVPTPDVSDHRCDGGVFETARNPAGQVRKFRITKPYHTAKEIEVELI